MESPLSIHQSLSPSSYSLPYPRISTSPFPHTPFLPSHNFLTPCTSSPFPSPPPCRPTTPFLPSASPLSSIPHFPLPSPLHIPGPGGGGLSPPEPGGGGLQEGPQRPLGTWEGPTAPPLTPKWARPVGWREGAGAERGTWVGRAAPEPARSLLAGSPQTRPGPSSSDHALGRAPRPPGRAATSAAAHPPAHAVSVPQPHRPAPPGRTKGASPFPGPGCRWGSRSQRQAWPERLPTSRQPQGAPTATHTPRASPSEVEVEAPSTRVSRTYPPERSGWAPPHLCEAGRWDGSGRCGDAG